MKKVVFMICLFACTLALSAADSSMSQQAMDDVMVTAQSAGIEVAASIVESEGVQAEAFDEVLREAGRDNDAVVWNDMMAVAGTDTVDPPGLPGTGPLIPSDDTDSKQ